MQHFTEEHPETSLIDPLEAMTLLCDRAVQYEFLSSLCDDHGEFRIFVWSDNEGIYFKQTHLYVFVDHNTIFEGAIRCPNFVKLTEASARQNQVKVSMMGVKFPAVCKPIVAHGSHNAHVVRYCHLWRAFDKARDAFQLTLVLNANSIAHLPTNCVAQTFHQHNGVLFKLFVIGDRHFTCLRPSLKNFSACGEWSQHFSTQSVRKKSLHLRCIPKKSLF